MTTAFQNGPGFYAARTSETNPRVQPGILRIYCARLEAYDIPAAAGMEDLETKFELLVAQAERDAEIARALLDLHESIGRNLDCIRKAAR
jgi:hypothetical protein